MRSRVGAARRNALDHSFLCVVFRERDASDLGLTVAVEQAELATRNWPKWHRVRIMTTSIVKLLVASLTLGASLGISVAGILSYRDAQAAMDRFDAVAKRLEAMSAAIKTVRHALASFYTSLTGEQKARFNTLGTAKDHSVASGMT